MCFKGIKNNILNIVLLSVALLWIVEPIVIYNDWVLGHCEIGAAYSSFVKWNQIIIPVTSVLCPIYLISEYISGVGNELLIMRTGNAVFKVAICNIIYLCFIVIPFFIVFSVVTEYPAEYCCGEIVRAIIISVVVVGVFYLISVMTGTMNIPILVFSAYCMLCLFSETENNYFFSFQKMYALKADTALKVYLPFFIIGVASYIVAGIYNKKKLKFN